MKKNTSTRNKTKLSRQEKRRKREALESLPSYVKASKSKEKPSVKEMVRQSLKWVVGAVVVLAVIGGGVYGWNAWQHAHPDAYTFGEGALGEADVQQHLVDLSSVLVNDAEVNLAYEDGDPYLLVTRLAEYDNGWYRIGVGDVEAYGVAVGQHGTVTVARTDTAKRCFLMRVVRTDAKTAADGSTILVSVDPPRIQFATFYGSVCDPASAGYSWGDGF